MAPPVHSASVLLRRKSLALLTLEAKHRQENRDRRGGARRRWGVKKERGGDMGKERRAGMTPPEEAASWVCLAPFIFLSLSTRLFFFLTKESEEPIWGKDKSLATGSQLRMDGEYPYQPI